MLSWRTLLETAEARGHQRTTNQDMRCEPFGPLDHAITPARSMACRMKLVARLANVVAMADEHFAER